VHSTDPAQSYAVAYDAEDVLDWDVATIGGVNKLTRVLLREFERDSLPQGSQNNPWINARIPNAVTARNAAIAGHPARTSARNAGGYTYKTIYRELVLELQDDGTYVYKQHVYDDDPHGEPSATLIPNVRGVPLGFIPFQFFGATSNSPDVSRAPLLDIADLNISHYRTYAELEHGRHFTALPIYYAPGRDDDGTADYHIGPNRVWEVPQGCAPGILEFSGLGLKSLESALSTKENQIAAIGGRLLAGQTRSSESDDGVRLREANEQSLILNVVAAAERGMALCVRWWLLFRDVPMRETESLVYQINLATTGAADARLLRSLHQMHEDGLVPIEVLYNVLIKVEWLDATTTIEEFKKMLADPASFPNNPDAIARQGGFTSRQQQLDQTLVAREAD